MARAGSSASAVPASGPGARGTAAWPGRLPNFLIILVDEERFPPGYETAPITQWRAQYLRAQEMLRDSGLEFVRHYTAATACAPARGSFFTGQYPSLHGVTQTTGVAKTAFENDTFWLDPGTVLTIGDYFRAAGYQTFYKGKWHVSDADILIPGTHTPLPSYDPDTGVRDLAIEQIYLDADRLDTFGFSGWIGPEPHGKSARDSGSSAATGVSGRDIGFADQVIALFDQLESRGQSQAPWLTVASFVNPHAIALRLFRGRQTSEIAQGEVLCHVCTIPPHYLTSSCRSVRPDAGGTCRWPRPGLSVSPSTPSCTNRWSHL